MSAEDIKVGDHVSLNPSRWTTTPTGRSMSDIGVVTFVSASRDSRAANVKWSAGAEESTYNIENLIKINNDGPPALPQEVETVMLNHNVYMSRDPDGGKRGIVNKRFVDATSSEKEAVRRLWADVDFKGYDYGEQIKPEFKNDGLYRSSSGPSNTFAQHHTSLINRINRATDRLAAAGAPSSGGGYLKNRMRNNDGTGSVGGGGKRRKRSKRVRSCLLYTSDAADE